MDDSTISLDAYEKKQKKLTKEKTFETAPDLKYMNLGGEQVYKPRTQASIKHYMKGLLRSLDDGEHVSLPLERVKERVSELLHMDSRESDYISKLMETADALDSFLDTHQGTYFIKYKKERKANVLSLKDSVMSILESQRREMNKEKGIDEENGPIQNEDEMSIIRFADKKRVEQAEAGVKELAGVMRKWRKRMGEYLINTPEETINQKLAIYEAYMEDILIYRDKTIFQDMPKECQKVIAEYDTLKLRADLISWDKTKEGHAENYKNENMEIAEEVAENLDSELVNKKSMTREYDKDLSDEQASGIQAIDRWMIRNFSNGGIFGSMFKMENAQEAFVQKILSLSKRERLYLYYMVETKARKTATVSELVKSQDYVPNLDEFKNQMLATKFKVTKRLSGGYVYWHKLTEAMQRLNGQGEVLESFLKGRKSILEEEKEDNKEKKIEAENDKHENAPEPGSLEALSQDRMVHLKSYYKGLNAIAKAIKEDKTNDEIEEIKKEADEAYKKLLESDEEIKKLVSKKEYVGEQFFKEVEGVTYVAMGTGYAGTAISKAPTIMDNTVGLFWNVRSWDWVSAQKGLTITSGTLGALTGLIGVVGGIMALSITASSTNAMDLTGQIAELSLGIAGIGMTIWGAVELAAISKEMAQMFMAGISYTSNAVAYSPIQKAGVGMAAVSLGVAAFQGVTAYNHHSNLKDAKAFFKTRDEKANKQLEANKGLLSGTAEERKAQKEARFHKNIAKLSEAAIEQKRDSAIFAGVIGATALVSAIFPELALLGLIVMGVGMALGATQSIVKFKKDSSTTYRAFDDYFNIDEIFERVREKQEKMGKAPAFDKMEPKVAAKKRAEYENLVKRNIRRQLAAKYGFSNVGGAKLYIASQYADYIRNVLYPPAGAPEPSPEDVKAMEALIKSMGLKLNREDDKPTVAQIRSKIAGS